MATVSGHRPVYLDHNATSPLRPEAREAMLAALEIGANPSSIHALGREARAVIESARADVAALVNAKSSEVIFTSGGTEANAHAISSAAAGGDIKRLIIGATEHDAVAANARASGLPVEVWPVDADGLADLSWLAARLANWCADDGRPFVVLMLANNETGVIQPVAEAAALIHSLSGRLHVDAVQAAGKIEIGIKALGADTLALSAHKLGGPQGVGALIVRDHVRLRAVLLGGGQEGGLRAGTENVAGIAGFAAAVRAAVRDLPFAADQSVWRDAAANRLAGEGAVIVGANAPRLSNTLCLAAPHMPSSLQVMSLDLEGVMVSAGAACSSGKVRPSSVLTAMGLNDLAGGALRASGGWNTTAQDWDRFADVWCALHARQVARAKTREFA
jgi:cysteine desulfurase